MSELEIKRGDEIVLDSRRIMGRCDTGDDAIEVLSLMDFNRKLWVSLDTLLLHLEEEITRRKKDEHEFEESHVESAERDACRAYGSWFSLQRLAGELKK